MAEVVLREAVEEAGLSGVEVTSAGVSAEEHGNPIDSRAAKVLRAHGHQVPADHHAHRATDAELQEADLILAMTTGHAHSLRDMLARIGQDAQKVHLWREFDGTLGIAPGGVFGAGGALNGDISQRSHSANLYRSSGEFDVPDPWYGTDADFAQTYDVVQRGAQGVVDYLQQL